MNPLNLYIKNRIRPNAHVIGILDVARQYVFAVRLDFVQLLQKGTIFFKGFQPRQLGRIFMPVRANRIID